MVEGSAFKRGGLSPKARLLEEQAKAYVTRMLTESGYRRFVPDRHIETAAGHYLFAKACLQAAAVQEYRQHGKRQERLFIPKLERSAITHTTIALHLAPTVVKEALGEIEDGDIRYPFHFARRFGISLAQKELTVRGKEGYQKPMNLQLESQAARVLRREGISPRQRQSVA